MCKCVNRQQTIHMQNMCVWNRIFVRCVKFCARRSYIGSLLSNLSQKIVHKCEACKQLHILWEKEDVNVRYGMRYMQIWINWEISARDENRGGTNLISQKPNNSREETTSINCHTESQGLFRMLGNICIYFNTPPTHSNVGSVSVYLFGRKNHSYLLGIFSRFKFRLDS